ncbi:hypothetical protein SLE2022_304330 [Rubroshorea leprosula]
MASKKKASEGIALLSMYNDEDDEDMEEDDQIGEEEQHPFKEENFFEFLEGDNGSSGQAMSGVEHQAGPVAVQLTPQSSIMESSQPTAINQAASESEAIEVEEAVKVSVETIDPLDQFLPPPPKAKCSEELQRKIDKFLNLKRAGKSFNAEVRNRKDYRNPDFLLHAVRYQDIDPIGSNFRKDVFDPHGYDKSDFIDEIEADMKREMERKKQENKKNMMVEFVSAGIQPTHKLSIPIAGASAGTAGATRPAPAAADNVARDGRSKKSKWDKMDGDWRNPPAGSQESLSTGVAHISLPSATNAGGYAAFVQQSRHREAEVKRTTEKSRRS